MAGRSCEAAFMRENERNAPTAEQRERLVGLIGRLAPVTGRSVTLWPGLSCLPTAQPTKPDPTVYTPSICIVGQGAKTATLGDRTYRYDALHYLVSGAHMPVTAW